MNSINKKKLIGQLDIYRSVLILLVICVFTTILSPSSSSVVSLFNMFRQITAAGIVGFDMTFVVLTGGIDLSVDFILGLVGVLASGILESIDNAGVAIPAVLAVGIGYDAVNGFFMVVYEIPPLISTLGMMIFLRGCIPVYTKGSSIPIKVDGYKFFGEGAVAGVSVPAIVLITLFLIAHYVLIQTSCGRSIYVFGDNRGATCLSGISVRLIERMAYVLNGPMCGVAGVILTARLGSAQFTGGTDVEMDAIAVAILGGVFLSGGMGLVFPTMVGAMTMGITDNTLTLTNINPRAANIVEGAVILTAVLVDRKAKDLSAKTEQQIENRANAEQHKCRAVKPGNGRRG